MWMNVNLQRKWVIYHHIRWSSMWTIISVEYCNAHLYFVRYWFSPAHLNPAPTVYKLPTRTLKDSMYEFIYNKNASKKEFLYIIVLYNIDKMIKRNGQWKLWDHWLNLNPNSMRCQNNEKSGAFMSITKEELNVRISFSF